MTLAYVQRPAAVGRPAAALREGRPCRPAGPTNVCGGARRAEASTVAFTRRATTHCHLPRPLSTRRCRGCTGDSAAGCWAPSALLLQRGAGAADTHRSTSPPPAHASRGGGGGGGSCCQCRRQQVLDEEGMPRALMVVQCEQQHACVHNRLVRPRRHFPQLPLPTKLLIIPRWSGTGSGTWRRMRPWAPRAFRLGARPSC
jgi:hypothetical protein